VTSGWTQGGTLYGNNGIVEADESASMTLTNTSLKSGTMALDLSGIKTAYLSVVPAAGQPRAIVNATAFSGVSNLVAAGAGNAILYSGSGADSSMSITGSGNDILIGNAPKMNLSGSGSGRSILIGAGSGGDTITGNGNDILVSGRTEFDSISPTNNGAALDEILAEWTSSAPYLIRISKIKVGLGPFHRFAFRSNTISADPKKNSLADGPLALHAGDWFLASLKDHVTRRPQEVKTII
jgi:Ca2+-binding RTX toxin-like protein